MAKTGPRTNRGKVARSVGPKATTAAAIDRGMSRKNVAPTVEEKATTATTASGRGMRTKSFATNCRKRGSNSKRRDGASRNWNAGLAAAVAAVLVAAVEAVTAAVPRDSDRAEPAVDRWAVAVPSVQWAVLVVLPQTLVLAAALQAAEILLDPAVARPQVGAEASAAVESLPLAAADSRAVVVDLAAAASAAQRKWNAVWPTWKSTCKIFRANWRSYARKCAAVRAATARISRGTLAPATVAALAVVTDLEPAGRTPMARVEMDLTVVPIARVEMERAAQAPIVRAKPATSPRGRNANSSFPLLALRAVSGCAFGATAENPWRKQGLSLRAAFPSSDNFASLHGNSARVGASRDHLRSSWPDGSKRMNVGVSATPICSAYALVTSDSVFSHSTRPVFHSSASLLTAGIQKYQPTPKSA